jgi:molybdate transport system substrate-binding protein
LRIALVESAVDELQRAVRRECPAQGSATIHLAAAISLQEAIGQILTEFALVRPAAHIRTIFGASNELADHALAGAPINLFISAESEELDRLAAAKLLTCTSRRIVAQNSLAIIGTADSTSIRKVADLSSKRIRHVALAEPASPLGRCSTSFLQAAGVFDRLLPKVLWVDNSRAVLSAVASQAADVGLAFASDASREGAWRTLLRVPQSKASATYEAALVGRQEASAEATALLEFLAKPKAQRCFRRCGLRIPTT